MFTMNDSFSFSGLAFWGSEHLPDDVLADLNLLRQWALDDGLIVDDGQFLNDEEIDELFSRDKYTPTFSSDFRPTLQPPKRQGVKWQPVIFWTGLIAMWIFWTTIFVRSCS